MKKSQLISVWLLPLISLGGLVYPYLGLLMLAMMAAMIPLSFFRARYWCANLCPRGAFLDLVMARMSANKPMPRFLVSPLSRRIIFILFIIVLMFRLSQSAGSWLVIGGIFVAMCVVTTAIAIVLTFVYRHRGWCAVCPMGFLQDHVGRAGKKFLEQHNKERHG